MRILFVAPYLPAPGSGGRTRFTNLLSRIATRHEIEVLCFREHDQVASELAFPGRVFEPGAPKPRPGGLKGKLRFYGERLDPLPQFAALRFDVSLAAAIRDACERFQPHVVQVETTEMGQYLRTVPWGPVLALDLQDVAHGWFERVRERSMPGKQRWTMRWEEARTRRYDREICRRADLVFVPSWLEADRIAAVAGVNAIEVANGVDTAYFDREAAFDEDVAADANRILFVGPLGYTANRDGLRWFADEVLPLVRMRVPDAYVAHVGTTIEEAFGASVTHHGRVADLRAWYAGAPVSIVPVRVGSGTRYKILEAFAMHGCVVSTSVGAEGLEAEHGQHLLLADDPATFADAVVRALGDEGLRMRLGDAGRALVEERFDWTPLVETMEDAWHDAAGRLLADASTSSP
jgi:glycosyltransferase involved in cell wall biosynthesis